MFQCKTASAGIFHYYTLVEVLVVISILSILMAISSNVAMKSRKAVVGQFTKIMPTIPEDMDKFGKDGKGSASQNESGKETNVRRNLAKAGILRGDSSKTNVSDKKLAVLQRGTVSDAKTGSMSQTADASKNTNSGISAEEDLKAIVFPAPEGIVPGKTVITISAPDAPETEVFAKFLYRNGSSGTLEEYRKSWTFNTDTLKEEKKFKAEHGIDISLFSQYLRKKAVFETSPYRTYVLRKKILLASRHPFNPEKSMSKYKSLAEKKYCLAQKGETVSVTTVRGKTHSGVYSGRAGKKILIKRYSAGFGRWISLRMISEGQRWRYDETMLNAKRDAYVKQAFAKEKELKEKQDEYIRKTLEAEFVMLKKDPLMTNIR